MLLLTSNHKKIIVGVMVLLLATIAFFSLRRKRGVKIYFSFPSLKKNTMQTIKKSQFNVVGIPGVLVAKNEQGEQRMFQPGSVKLSSTNEAVLKIMQDTEDQTKFSVEYVGAGTATINVTANILADQPTTAEGSLEVTVEDDAATETANTGEGNSSDTPPPPAEVVKIELSLNL